MRLLLATVAFLFGAASQLIGDEPPSELRGLVKAHCLHCHDSATRSSGLDLEKLPLSLDDLDTFDKWVLIHDRLAAGEMP